MELVIGNKNYSSWSLRPWLIMRANNLDFNEVKESLNQGDIKQRLGKYSDSCKVPVLIDKGEAIWDSLAICEYLSEAYLDGKGWPENTIERAIARSICSEMHSGFTAIRSELPMNCKLSKPMALSQAVQAEVQRIDAIWSKYAKQTECGKVFLFGTFSIADCFYAPIALRFNSYGVSLSQAAADYQASILSHPAVLEWIDEAIQETDIVAENEV